MARQHRPLMRWLISSSSLMTTIGWVVSALLLMLHNARFGGAFPTPTTSVLIMSTNRPRRIRRSVLQQQKHQQSLSTSSDEPTSTTDPSSSSSQQIDWHVYVDQSKASLERGASATLDAFWGLAPPNVQVHPTLLNTNVKKNKLPIVRCLPTRTPNGEGALEVTNVDSVDKVYRILIRHMKCGGGGRYRNNNGDHSSLSPQTLECLKWKYKANSHLEANELTLAISAYDKALECCTTTTTTTNNGMTTTTIPSPAHQQEGPLLLLRASAHLKRSQQHKKELQRIFRKDWKATTMTTSTTSSLSSSSPSNGEEHHGSSSSSSGSSSGKNSNTSSSSFLKNNLDTYQIVSQQIAQKHPTLAMSALSMILSDTKRQQKLFRRTKYQHGLLQYALLHAAQDALRATEIYSDSTKTTQSWLTAGEILSELWKLQDAIAYYKKAMTILSSSSTTTTTTTIKTTNSNNKEEQKQQQDTTTSMITKEEIQEIIDKLSERQDLLKQASTYGWSEDTWRLALDVAG